MNEQEPKYVTKIISKINDKIDLLDGKMEIRFDKLDKKIEKEIGDLAAMTALQFRRVDAEFAEIRELMMTQGEEIRKEMMTKEEGHKIISHIGMYEMRSQNIKQILLRDHKPRIIDLEKEVYSDPV